MQAVASSYDRPSSADLQAIALLANLDRGTANIFDDASMPMTLVFAGAIRLDAQRWWHAVLPEELTTRLQALLTPVPSSSSAMVRVSSACMQAQPS